MIELCSLAQRTACAAVVAEKEQRKRAAMRGAPVLK